MSVKTNWGQLAVRKDEPGLPTGSLNASVPVGLSKVSCYFIADCSRSWIKQMISVIQDGPQDRTKR